MGLIYAGLMVLMGLSLVKVKERPEFSAGKSNPLVPGVRRAFQNRPFRIVVITGIIVSIPAVLP
ncbi:MAG: hypothetical protein GY866_02880 [Proteobacteria bacterium]|nr:hypothetical protein [Pseudomonadota bacterium]